MSISSEYIQTLICHLVHSDEPITASILVHKIKASLGAEYDHMILGTALTKTDIRQKYMYKPSPSGFPRKYKAYYVDVLPNQGNIKLSNKRSERAKEKARKTKERNKKDNIKAISDNIRTNNLSKLYQKYI